MIGRRGLFGAIAGLIAAPSIVRAASLMPVVVPKLIVPEFAPLAINMLPAFSFMNTTVTVCMSSAPIPPWGQLTSMRSWTPPAPQHDAWGRVVERETFNFRDEDYDRDDSDY